MKELKHPNTLGRLTHGIDVMRKYKEDNRLITDLRIDVGQKVFDQLCEDGLIDKTEQGKNEFRGIPLFVMANYPADYICVS